LAILYAAAMSVLVRPLGAAERDVAARLLTAQLVEHKLPADAAQIAAGLDQAFLPHSPAWLRLAERDHQAVGILLANEIVSVETGGRNLWLEELYVVPEARRTGVARAMLHALAVEARSRGIKTLQLEVVRTQAAAFALYQALGFHAVDRARLDLDLTQT
jgi:GNAT superfamily N-acetyltransferase